MARGFESKDIEYQQAEAQRPRTNTGVRSAAEREADARRQTLELSIVRTESDLRAATSPVHRRMLEQALAALRERVGGDAGRDAE
jgi:hypothetical protein